MNSLEWPDFNFDFDLQEVVQTHPRLTRAAVVVAGSYAAYKVSGYLLREYFFVPNLTMLGDLPALGKPRKGGKKLGRKAVVCGGRWVRVQCWSASKR